MELEVASQTYSQLIQALNAHNKSAVVIGASLKKIRDEHLYKQFGKGGNDTFVQFLNNPEIGMSQRSAYNYISLYEQLIERLGFSFEEVSIMPHSRMIEVLPSIKALPVPEAKDKINEVVSLTTSDYRQHYKKENNMVQRPNLYLEEGKWVIETAAYNTKRLSVDGGIVWKSD